MFVCARSMRLALGLMTAVLIVGTGAAFAAPSAPTLNAPVVAGPRVTLSWTASPGALGYRLAIGMTPGAEDYAQVVGYLTSVTFTVPFTGTGYVRAQAFDASGLSAPSNEVVLTVTTMTPVPAAPTDLRAVLIGQNVALSWAAGQGGGPPLGVLVEAGTAPGLANLGTTALPLSTSVTAPNVPPGTYFVRVYAINGSGRSDPSNELQVDMPVGGGCTAPGATTLSVTAGGGAVAMNWAAVGGAAGYRSEPHRLGLLLAALTSSTTRARTAASESRATTASRAGAAVANTQVTTAAMRMNRLMVAVCSGPAESAMNPRFRAAHCARMHRRCGDLQAGGGRRRVGTR